MRIILGRKKSRSMDVSSCSQLILSSLFESISSFFVAQGRQDDCRSFAYPAIEVMEWILLHPPSGTREPPWNTVGWSGGSRGGGRRRVQGVVKTDGKRSTQNCFFFFFFTMFPTPLVSVGATCCCLLFRCCGHLSDDPPGQQKVF